MTKLVVVGLCGAVTMLGFWWWRRKGRGQWVRVGTVDELCVYPIKGGVAKSVPVADFGLLGVTAGVFRDRTFGFVKDSGESANAREFARISQLDLSYREGCFVLSAPNRPPLTLDPSDLEPTPDRMMSMKLYDIHVNVLHLGIKYDDYVTEFVTGGAKRLRMVYHCSKEAQRPVRPKLRQLWPDTFKDGDVTTLSDQTSFTVLSWASVHRLNQELPEDKRVTPGTFRSNVIVKTDSGKPFKEDKWGRIRLGDNVELRYNKPCNRCMAITVAPNSGRADPQMEPLRTLRKFRLLDPSTSEAEARRRKAIGESPLFAVHHSLANAAAAGTVRIGDPVYAQIKS